MPIIVTKAATNPSGSTTTKALATNDSSFDKVARNSISFDNLGAADDISISTTGTSSSMSVSVTGDNSPFKLSDVETYKTNHYNAHDNSLKARFDAVANSYWTGLWGFCAKEFSAIMSLRDDKPTLNNSNVTFSNWTAGKFSVAFPNGNKKLVASSWSETSDVRFKSDIRDLEDDVEIYPKQFSWKDSETRDLGIIAQQFDNSKYRYTITTDGYRRICLSAAIVLLLLKFQNKVRKWQQSY